MKFNHALIGAIAAATAATTLIGVTSSPSAAAETGYQFSGTAAGSLVRAFNNTITSDLTAASSIDTEELESASNSLSRWSLPALLDSGVITTSAASSAIPGGYQVRSQARTTGVKLLGGLISADAIDTITIANVVNGVASSSTQTTFTNLKVGLAKQATTVKPNTTIEIPLVGTVTLNSQQVFAEANKSEATGVGISVRLLKPYGANSIGATVALNPTKAQISPSDRSPSGHSLFGRAYGTKVSASLGTVATITSDESAPITIPRFGTDGLVVTNSIAGATLNQNSQVGLITNSAQGTNTAFAYDGTTSSRITSIRLLDGLITADAVESMARVRGPAIAAVPTVTGASTFTNLVINGTPYAYNPEPNTVITIPGVAIITLNQQIRATNRTVIVRAIDVQLLVASAGSPAGAEIEVAVSRAGADVIP